MRARVKFKASSGASLGWTMKLVEVEESTDALGIAVLLFVKNPKTAKMTTSATTRSDMISGTLCGATSRK